MTAIHCTRCLGQGWTFAPNGRDTVKCEACNGTGKNGRSDDA